MASPPAPAPKFDGGSKVFDRGSKVEVSSSDPGFTGAWFEATVVRCGVKKGRLSVDYDRIVSESDPSKPHHEVVDLFHVRPRPPPPPPKPRHFLVGDKVEVFYHDCWWAGEVHQVLDASSRYVVRCVDGDVLDFSPSDLRPRLDWVDRKWVSFPNPLDMGDFFSNCKIDNPMNHMEEKLELLVELESQGYKIEAIRMKITELIDLKGRFTQCICKLNNLKDKMQEKKHIIGGMNMDIEELDESLSRLKRLREKGKSKLAELQAALKEVIENYQVDHKCGQDRSDERIAPIQESISSCEQINAGVDSRIYERQQFLSRLKRERDKEFTVVTELQKELEELGKEAQKCRLDFIKVAAASM